MSLATKAGFAILAAVTLLLWEVGRADAAAIVWGSPNTISGDTNVDTTGTLVGAFNMGRAGVPTTTVNVSVAGAARASAIDGSWSL